MSIFQNIFNTDAPDAGRFFHNRVFPKLNNNFSFILENFLPLSGGTVSGDTLFNQNLSATTIYSGSTDLSNIFVTPGFVYGSHFLPISGGIMTGDIDISGYTKIKSAYDVNTYLFFGGSSPYIELNHGSGGTNFITIEDDASKIKHASYIEIGLDTLGRAIVIEDNGSSLIGVGPTAQQAVVINSSSAVVYSGVQNSVVLGGSNIQANLSNTAYVPKIGFYFASGDGILSSSTLTTDQGWALPNQSGIIALTSDLSRIQNGLNTYTGGTDTRPTINISSATLNNLTVSGSVALDNYYPSAGIIHGNENYINPVDGTITLPDVEVSLFDNPNFTGGTRVYSVTGGTTGSEFTSLSNNDTNYIYIDYNSGNPQYVISTSNSAINGSDVVRAYTIYRLDNFLHILKWDNSGAGLSNKIENRLVGVEKFAWESGLQLGLSGSTGIVTLSEGVSWNGSIKNELTSLNSYDDEFFFVYHSGGSWTYTTTATTLNNTHYDNGSNLVAISGNKYVVNWYYRGQESGKYLYQVLSNNEYSNISEARISNPPSVPTLISSNAFLVGRIIVQYANNTGITESAFYQSFQAASVENHNDLANLQGGSFEEYYHLTANEYSNIAFNSGFTKIQNGLNIYTGGTNSRPTINISGASLDNIYVSGSSTFGNILPISHLNYDLGAIGQRWNYLYARGIRIGTSSTEIDDGSISVLNSGLTITTVGDIITNSDFIPSANTTHSIGSSDKKWLNSWIENSINTNLTGNTIFSGTTDLSDIFATKNELTKIQPGSNITTGGTSSLPIINVVDSPIFENLTLSGQGLSNSFSATTLSGGTLFSGSTNLYDIFSTTETQVQPGTNIQTGGTLSNPIISTIDSPSFSNISFSGTSTGGNLFASNLSGSTIFSGSTNIESLFTKGSGSSGYISKWTGGTSLGQSSIYDDGDNIGIGTASPSARIHIMSGAVLFEGNSGSTPTTGQGKRMMWVPDKSAFRVGETAYGGASGYWDDSNIGRYSFAFGLSSKASGEYSFAGGRALAEGQYSFAYGGSTTRAAETGGIAIGQNSIAYGTDSVVLGGGSGGNQSYAYGTGSLVIGFSSNASDTTGYYNTAIGVGNQISKGIQSTAIGRSNIISLLSSAYGNSVAIGYLNKVYYAGNSVAIGVLNTLSGESTTVLGYNNTSELPANRNTVLGADNIGTGIRNFTIGANLKGEGTSSFIIGVGISTALRLTATTSNTISLGTNSTVPTVIIAGGDGTADSTGAMSIGANITSPGAKLHVEDDDGSDIVVFKKNGGTTAFRVDTDGIIYSGSTDLYDIFSTGSGDITRIQPGTNIQTGGTANEPIISTIDSPSFNNLYFSGTSTGGNIYAINLSGATIYSGSTDLGDLLGGGGASGGYTTLTDAATVVWNYEDGQTAEVTLGGNRALSITNASAGDYGTLKVIQDGTGSRTLSLPSGSKVADGGGGTVVLTSTAGAVDLLTFMYDGTNYWWNIAYNYN